MDRIYKIKKGLFIPLAVDAVLVLALLVLSFFKKSSALETVVLVVILIPLAVLVLECIFREVTVSDTGLTIRKLMRRKALGWGDITDVGTVVMRNKVYLVLTTTKGFHIISNAYDGFAMLVKGIVDHVEAQRIEEPVKVLIEKPIRKVSDVVSAWAGAVVLLMILYVKVFLL